MTRLFILFLFLICYASSNAQTKAGNGVSDSTIRDSSAVFHIRNIVITGNRKTKDYIINREIQFKVGDSIPAQNFLKEIELARQQVYNTTLFTETHIDPTITKDNNVDLLVTVREKWYLYPTPQFQLVDRNFNEWLVKYKGDLSRVNYGLKFVHYNLSGRRDQLRVYLINGYSRNISASYVNPYSNSKLTQGFSVGGSISQFREIGYKTNYDNTIARFNNGRFIYKSWNINASYSIRKAIKYRQGFTISYTHISVADSLITKLNPNYFNDGSEKKGIIDLVYSMSYNKVNNAPYPTIGASGSFVVLKRGLGWKGGINMLSAEGNFEKFYSLGHNWFTSFQVLGRIKLPFTQSYINQRALGFGENYLRGQEYFAIDGVAHAVGKLNLKKQLAAFTIKSGLKWKSFQKIPFRILAKTYGDLGYAYNKAPYISRLNNKLLYTGGFGLDIITLYDIQIRIEYSFNQLGEKGLFLHN